MSRQPGPASDRTSRASARPSRRSARRGIRWSRVLFIILAVMIIGFMILSTIAPLTAGP